MIKQKKGIVEVQFNWLFILIVGVIILLFFVSLTQWYRGSKEKELASDVLYKLDNILTGAQISSRSASQIDMPSIGLVFSCDPDECSDYGCASSIEFEGSGIAEDTAMDIIFSQESLKTELLDAWSLDWNVAYKVTNFLYLSTPDIKYYLVYDPDDTTSEDFAKSVFSKIGENKYLDVKLIDGSEVEDQEYNGESFVRFVLFYLPAATDSIDVSQSMQKSNKWDVLFVDGDEVSGHVMFSMVSGGLMKPDETKDYPYLGLPSLIGAIYSQDFDDYKCNMRKALLRLRAVNDIYLERTKKLYDYYAGDMQCEFYYDTETTDQFEAIKSALADPGNLQASDISSIVSAVDNIKNYNSQANIRSCPRIY